MPGMRTFRASTDVGGIDPGNTQGGRYTGGGHLREHRLNFLGESLRIQPIREAGRVPGGHPSGIGGSAGSSPRIPCVKVEEVKQAPPHRTVMRRADEPKLEIGDKIPIEEGVVGIVLARYPRSSDPRQDVHYIVELRPKAEEH
jgi:hypothetical protein